MLRRIVLLTALFTSVAAFPSEAQSTVDSVPHPPRAESRRFVDGLPQLQLAESRPACPMPVAAPVSTDTSMSMNAKQFGKDLSGSHMPVARSGCVNPLDSREGSQAWTTKP